MERRTVLASIRRAVLKTPLIGEASRFESSLRSIDLNRRTFAVFDAALFGAFFAEGRDAQVPNLVVDLTKGRFGKFVRRLDRFLELRDARQCAINLFVRQ